MLSLFILLLVDSESNFSTAGSFRRASAWDQSGTRFQFEDGERVV